MEAAGLITAREMEQRVLILRDPGFGDRAAITDTLLSGLQLIMPGEVARAHPLHSVVSNRPARGGPGIVAEERGPRLTGYDVAISVASRTTVVVTVPPA